MAEIPNMPGNSHKEKTEKIEKAHVVEKVTTGVVTSRKPSFLRRTANNLLADDVGNIRSYLLSDVVVPAIRDTIVDLVENGIRLMVYGTTTGRRANKKGGTPGQPSYVSYNGYYSGSNKKDRSELQQPQKSKDFDDFVFENKGDAEMVLDQMLELIDLYGQVTVNDFFDLIGKTGDFTDDRWGWRNLANASTKRVSGGYIIILPRVQALN